jgi:hypothetical protein
VLAGVVCEALTGFFHSVVKTSGDLRFDVSEDLEFAAMRQAARLQFRVVEVAAEPDVLIIKQVLVDPFKVESKVEGTPHARVLELRPRMLNTKACIGATLAIGSDSSFTKPRLTASKSKAVAQALALLSRQKSRLLALKASKAGTRSRK